MAQARDRRGLARQCTPTALAVLAPELPLTPSPVPHPVDVHVGGRLRLARTLKGCSQETLGQSIGVSAQQVQKYESGANRISASALFRLCGYLGRPVGWMFEGLEPTGPADGGSADVVATLMSSREGAQLAMAMARLSPVMRRKVLAVVKAFLPDGPSGDGD
jgi:transcriptional regulator with XRE-family HTH domain